MGQVCIEIVQAYHVRDEIVWAWAGAKDDLMWSLLFLQSLSVFPWGDARVATE
jgi:hypothetical protein